MHIPDGFLNVKTAATTIALSAGSLALIFRRARRSFQERFVPRMGVMAAFIFAAQMFNFPVAAGTSGHLLGGVLAAVLLGPVAASIILTCVLIVQSLLFQDGGLFALGANIFNMAIGGVWGGYIVYMSLKNILRMKGGEMLSVGIAAWFSVVLAATLCSFELAASGIVPLMRVLPAMVGVHVIIGIGEGLITCAVVSLVKKVEPSFGEVRS